MKAELPSSKSDYKKNYIIRFKGKEVRELNPDLAVSQGLTVDDLRGLRHSHRKMIRVFEKMEKETCSCKLKKLASEVEGIEFEIQDLWRFGRDRDKHSWWYKCPKCQCPKIDNKDMWGTGMRIMNSSCPIHA